MTKEDQFELFWRAYPRRTAKKPCSVAGCDGEHRGLGFCSSHLNRLKRYGSPFDGSTNAKQGSAVRWLQDIWSVDTNKCQVWPFRHDGNGYAIFALNGVNHRAHRFCCEMFHGPAPSDVHEAAHECGVSLCCNKRHLSWKTHADNIADKRVHGTLPIGEAHHQAKLTDAKVREIRSSRGRISRRALADTYGVGVSTIDNVLDNVTWRGVA